MAFNCSIILSDIDINCNKRVTGGIKKAILALQSDITITFNPSDETEVTNVDLLASDTAASTVPPSSNTL